MTKLIPPHLSLTLPDKTDTIVITVRTATTWTLNKSCTKAHIFVTIQRTQKPKDYHHEEHEAHEGRFKQL